MPFKWKVAVVETNPRGKKKERDKLTKVKLMFVLFKVQCARYNLE